ncbi:hypothetical protein Mapa_005896 [Marchantia paleacea]|nr:hypothetical protein Mapa_005896 [Marchantia paleacea]
MIANICAVFQSIKSFNITIHMLEKKWKEQKKRPQKVYLPGGKMLFISCKYVSFCCIHLQTKLYSRR